MQQVPLESKNRQSWDPWPIKVCFKKPNSAFLYASGSGEKDKYSSHNFCSLQDFDKSFDKLITYKIFEIDFNT